ncbi:hypothetical protein ACFC5T_16870 [Streptomyces sp. NPDC055961]|uniref:hypothetical protein n=1 Tax=Streptomyces sp. NPDC055961 TaxID=3345666 RepID=UPI0035DA74BE
MNTDHPSQRYREREAARDLFVQHLADECVGLQLSAEGNAVLPHLQAALAAIIDPHDLLAADEFLQQAEEASAQDRVEGQRGGLGTRLLILTTLMPGETLSAPCVASRVGMEMICNLAAHCPDFPLNDFLGCARRALRVGPWAR